MITTNSVVQAVYL